ncbi:MAG: hypothetical protein KF862_09310 [Chitinophagaceae bacterium]|nr:hypothetical protein [Chitinophagaceae bacterium]
MRVVLLIFILFCSTGLKAQNYLPFYPGSYLQQNMLRNNSITNENLAGKKWFVSRYSAVSAGYSFFRGGSFNFISAPIGLQLNRRLNNNVYAFAGVSVAPTYINFNQPVPLSGMNKGMYGSSLYRPHSFGVYPKAELGLMYINDEKTFSISGSISVQKGGYSTFPYQQVNTQQNNMITRPGR